MRPVPCWWCAGTNTNSSNRPRAGIPPLGVRRGCGSASFNGRVPTRRARTQNDIVPPPVPTASSSAPPPPGDGFPVPVPGSDPRCPTYQKNIPHSADCKRPRNARPIGRAQTTCPRGTRPGRSGKATSWVRDQTSAGSLAPGFSGLLPAVAWASALNAGCSSGCSSACQCSLTLPSQQAMFSGYTSGSKITW